MELRSIAENPRDGFIFLDETLERCTLQRGVALCTARARFNLAEGRIASESVDAAFIRNPFYPRFALRIVTIDKVTKKISM